MGSRQTDRYGGLRSVSGTNVNMSSVVRTTYGMPITASATAPAHPGEMAHRRDHHLVNEKADHDPGAEQDVVDERTTLVRRS
jgi:hypothetical protein